MLAEITKLLGTLGVGILLAYFGLRLYFRQKEYEIVKQRYLEQSLDVIAGELESLSSTLNHNWARCLVLLKEYRDSPHLFEVQKLQTGFLDLHGTHFNRSAHHRLQVLSGTDVFWRVYQLALSRHLGLNSVAANEIPHAVKAQLDGNANASVEQIVEVAMQELKPMPRESDRFAPLHSALVQLSRLLERERLSFDKVETFARKPEVVQIVRDISAHYASDLSETPPNNSSKPTPLRGAA